MLISYRARLSRRDRARPQAAIVIGRAESEMLWLTMLGLWAVTYILINLSPATVPLDHYAERALRRLVTCAAGVGLCMAMAPLMMRAAFASLRKRILIAILAAFGAYIAHLLVRLGVFHLYRPLWGPLSLNVAVEALGGAGWMFPIWASACLVVFGDARARSAHSHAAPSDTQYIPPDPARADPAASESPPAADCFVWCMHRGARLRVILDDVIMLAAERDYVRLHTLGQSYMVRGPLKHWLKALPIGRFTQVHRSAIVRNDAVTALERAGSVWRVRLQGGHQTLVSRTKSSQVRNWLTDGVDPQRPNHW